MTYTFANAPIKELENMGCNRMLHQYQHMLSTFVMGVCLRTLHRSISSGRLGFEMGNCLKSHLQLVSNLLNGYCAYHHVFETGLHQRKRVDNENVASH